MEYGQHYSRSSAFQDQMWRLLLHLLRNGDFNTKKVTSLLDLGCGTGARTIDALQVFPNLGRIVAVDSDASMIQVARESNSDPRIEYRQQDIRALGELVSQPFDVVTSHWVLHWIEEKDALLENLQRLTLDSAFLLIAVSERLPRILAKLDGLLRAELNPIAPFPYFCLDREQWIDLLMRHGWEPIAIESHRELRAAPADGSYIRDWYAASTGRAFYGATLDDLGTGFIDKASRELTKLFGSADGKSWVFEEEALFLLAQRRVPTGQ